MNGILILKARVLTPVVAPLLTPTDQQIKQWRLLEKYGSDVKHVDRFFWRTCITGKPQPTIMGSAVIGALNQQIPEFKQLRKKHKDEIQCLGIVFNEDDVILEKRMVTQESTGKKTLAISEVVSPASIGLLMIEAPQTIHGEIKQILNKKTIKIGSLKSRGYGRILIEA